MASISFCVFHKAATVRGGSEGCAPWQAVQIDVGGSTLCLSREEAAQLAADLLNAAGAQPAEGQA